MTEMRQDYGVRLEALGSLPLLAPDAVRYQMVCSLVEAEGLVSFVYGLQCLGRYGTAWVQMDVVQDLSMNRDYVLYLADRFQQLQLSPLHFRDTVLDAVNR